MHTLFKVSLIISIAGILLLLFLSNFLEPKLTNITNISKKMLNQRVKIQGFIADTGYNEKFNFQLFSLGDNTGEIDVITNKKLNLTINEEIVVIGKVQDYKNNLQIQADKIIKK